MNRHFGLSNIYLKAGFVLVAISVVMLIAPMAGKDPGGDVAGFCFVAGAVLYVMGRIAQARRSRTQA